jgi:hypothetical protein
VKKVEGLIKQFNPKAFYSMEEVNFVEKGVFPAKPMSSFGSFIRIFRPFRKGK